MEQATPAEIGKNALEAQMRECFGRVVYSTKTHEKCADLCMGRLQWVKIAQIVLSAITTGGLITALLGDPKVAQIATVCWRRLNLDSVCRSNFDRGRVASVG